VYKAEGVCCNLASVGVRWGSGMPDLRLTSYTVPDWGVFPTLSGIPMCKNGADRRGIEYGLNVTQRLGVVATDW